MNRPLLSSPFESGVVWLGKDANERRKAGSFQMHFAGLPSSFYRSDASVKKTIEGTRTNTSNQLKQLLTGEYEDLEDISNIQKSASISCKGLQSDSRQIASLVHHPFEWRPSTEPLKPAGPFPIAHDSTQFATALQSWEDEENNPQSLIFPATPISSSRTTYIRAVLTSDSSLFSNSACNPASPPYRQMRGRVAVAGNPNRWGADVINGPSDRLPRGIATTNFRWHGNQLDATLTPQLDLPPCGRVHFIKGDNHVSRRAAQLDATTLVPLADPTQCPMRWAISRSSSLSESLLPTVGANERKLSCGAQTQSHLEANGALTPIDYGKGEPIQTGRRKFPLRRSFAHINSGGCAWNDEPLEL